MTLSLVETLNSNLFSTSKRRPSATSGIGDPVYLLRCERALSKTGTIPRKLSVLSHYAVQVHLWLLVFCPQWDVDLLNQSSIQGYQLMKLWIRIYQVWLRGQRLWVSSRLCLSCLNVLKIPLSECHPDNLQYMIHTWKGCPCSVDICQGQILLQNWGGWTGTGLMGCWS